MKRIWFGAAFLLAVLLMGPCAGAAAQSGFRPALVEEEGRAGDVVDLCLPYDGSLGEIGAFFVRVEYEESAFEYLRVRESAQVHSAYATTLTQPGEVGSAYTLKRREEPLFAPGDTFTYRFRIREEAEPGEQKFFVSIYEIVDPEPKALGDDLDAVLTYTVLPPPNSDASLRSLSPDSGVLEPEFSPDRLTYTMSVPFETTAVTFTAEPAEGATSRVNRKNLGAGGSDTLFLITVTAEDGETKTEYRVTVHREKKAAAAATEKPSVTPKPTKTPKPGPTKAPAATERPTASKAEKTPVPSASPSPKGEASAAQGTPSPVPAAVKTGGGGNAPPPIVMNNGEMSLFPMILGLIAFLSVLAVSDPIAKMICQKLPEKKRQDGDGKTK